MEREREAKEVMLEKCYGLLMKVGVEGVRMGSWVEGWTKLEHVRPSLIKETK